MNEANPSEQVIAIKSLEAFEKAADGKATKIIIPPTSRAWRAWPPSLKELVVDTPPATEGKLKQREAPGRFPFLYFPIFPKGIKTTSAGGYTKLREAARRGRERRSCL